MNEVIKRENLLKESEKALTVPVTSEDERIKIAQELGNKNQRKLAWIGKRKFVVLSGLEQIYSVCENLLGSKNYGLEYEIEEDFISLKEYPLPIPMSVLMTVKDALANCFSKEDIYILDPELIQGKDPLILAFVSKKHMVGAVISQWL